MMLLHVEEATGRVLMAHQPKDVDTWPEAPEGTVVKAVDISLNEYFAARGDAGALYLDNLIGAKNAGESDGRRKLGRDVLIRREKAPETPEAKRKRKARELVMKSENPEVRALAELLELDIEEV